MFARIKFFANRVKLLDGKFFKHAGQLAHGQFHALLVGFHRWVVHFQRRFHAVLDGQQRIGDFFDAVFLRLEHVLGRAAADIVGFGLGTQPFVFCAGRGCLGRNQAHTQRVEVILGLSGFARIG